MGTGGGKNLKAGNKQRCLEREALCGAQSQGAVWCEAGSVGVEAEARSGRPLAVCSTASASTVTSILFSRHPSGVGGKGAYHWQMASEV